MSKRYAAGVLVAFVLLDLALTFWQNYQLPLDGDLVATVFPAPFYTPVLHDPFGWAVLTKNETYAATNRFFAHATMSLYWKTVPLLLQRITSPISSLYAASALFTTATHALLVLMLAVYIRQTVGGQHGRGGFWVVAALLVPLFQTEGFNEQMGITNRAITYTFFYGFPMALLLVLLWPFYRAACQQQPLRLPAWRAALLLGLMVVIAFNGPVATASIAVLLAGIGAHWAQGQWRAGLGRLRLTTPAGGWLSWQAVGLLGALGALCLYSIYIGRNNVENSHDHTLAQLYRLLPTGVDTVMGLQQGLPTLFLLLLLNALLVRHLLPASLERRRVLLVLLGAVGFALAYLLLLPFGGYRPYRPHLLRNDSVLPVLLGFIFAYGLSTYFLLLQLRGSLRGGYLALVCGVGLFFMNADRALQMPVNNGCERWSMDQLARAPEPVVRLSPYCTVLTWTPFTDYHQSELNAEMLRYWGVTSTKKLYHH